MPQRCDAAADADGAGRGLVGIGLQPGDQFLQIVRRQVLLADDQQRRARRAARPARNPSARRTAACRARRCRHVRRPVAEARACSRRAPRARRGRRRGCRRRRPTFSMMIGWPSDALHALGQDARERVGRPAGGERHDHGDRTRRIGLRRARRRCRPARRAPPQATAVSCIRASARSDAAVRRPQLHLDVGRLDDRPPLVDLGLVEGGERLRRLLARAAGWSGRDR